MSKPTAEVKNRWNNAHYDRVTITVPKGEKERIKAYATSQGQSMNALILDLLHREMIGFALSESND